MENNLFNVPIYDLVHELALREGVKEIAIRKTDDFILTTRIECNGFVYNQNMQPYRTDNDESKTYTILIIEK